MKGFKRMFGRVEKRTITKVLRSGCPSSGSSGHMVG